MQNGSVTDLNTVARMTVVEQFGEFYPTVWRGSSNDTTRRRLKSIPLPRHAQQFPTDLRNDHPRTHGNNPDPSLDQCLPTRIKRHAPGATCECHSAVVSAQGHQIGETFGLSFAQTTGVLSSAMRGDPAERTSIAPRLGPDGTFRRGVRAKPDPIVAKTCIIERLLQQIGRDRLGLRRVDAGHIAHAIGNKRRIAGVGQLLERPLDIAQIVLRTGPDMTHFAMAGSLKGY